MMKRSHQIITNHESRVRFRHKFQELGDLSERTRSLCGLQKQQEEKNPNQFSPFVLLFSLYERLLWLWPLITVLSVSQDFHL